MKKNDNAVDLGKLQAEYIEAKKELTRANKMLVRMTDIQSKAEDRFNEARLALISASSAVVLN